MAFDLKEIIKAPNTGIQNVRKSTADFVEAVNDARGSVNDVRGVLQSGTRQYESTKEQIKSSIDVVKEVLGLKNSTDDFLNRKAEIASPDKNEDKKIAENNRYIESLPKPRNNHVGVKAALAELVDRGISKTNRFRVEIPLPKVFKNAKYQFGDSSFFKPSDQMSNMSEQLINVTIEGFAFPGINFDTMLTNYGGFKTPVAVGYNVDEISMLMRCSADMVQKNFFDNWVSCVYNFEKGGFRFYSDYAVDIKVYQLDDYGSDMYGIMLQGAYPKVVNSLDLNTSDQGVYHRLNIQWAYERYMPIKI